MPNDQEVEPRGVEEPKFDAQQEAPKPEEDRIPTLERESEWWRGSQEHSEVH